jgi:hypothetical protein
MEDWSILEKIMSKETAAGSRPSIDYNKLREIREMLERLEARGVRRKEYDLAPTGGGRRVIPIYDPPVKLLPNPHRGREFPELPRKEHDLASPFGSRPLIQDDPPVRKLPRGRMR